MFLLLLLTLYKRHICMILLVLVTSMMALLFIYSYRFILCSMIMRVSLNFFSLNISLYISFSFEQINARTFSIFLKIHSISV